jgi:hypothetical protein
MTKISSCKQMISAYAKATGTQDSNSSINSNASMVEVKEDSHIPGWDSDLPN